LKIALVCDWYHPRVGGIELHLQDLARHLAAVGHDVVVITPTPGEPLVNGIRVRRIRAPLAPVFGFLMTPAGVRAIGETLADERVDVAHCHVSIISPAALGGSAVANRRRIPAVLTFHSIVPRVDLLAQAANRAFGVSRWNVKFSAVTNRVARDVRSIAGANAMHVLSNGIDVDFWRVEPVARRNETIRMLSVLRLNSKKRPLALVSMMQRLAGVLPSSARVHLRVVGDGPQRARLERAIARARLDGHIELLGRRSRDEIRALLSQTDVFVSPTVRESFGLAALEARCAGVPVVAMRASGVSELIEHEREGLLASSDADLATQVARLIADIELREAIARHNRTSAPPCDWPHVVDAHLALYRDAIALRANV
jgi:glycosyltransferase involved in cell wall biosynthesis